MVAYDGSELDDFAEDADDLKDLENQQPDAGPREFVTDAEQLINYLRANQHDIADALDLNIWAVREAINLLAGD